MLAAPHYPFAALRTIGLDSTFIIYIFICIICYIHVTTTRGIILAGITAGCIKNRQVTSMF